jgi:ABC-type multidrug transport system fused ATPase/permease subunit
VYQSKIAETLKLGIRSSMAYGIFNGGTTGITSLAFIAIIYYGGTLVLSGEMSSGDLTSFLLYALTIGASLGGLAGLFGSVMNALGANDRVFQILGRIPLVPREGKRVSFMPKFAYSGVHTAKIAEGATMDEVLGAISFDNVTFAYPARSDAVVLKHLSFTVPAGTVAAFVGPSGGGKSTIISLIERFYDPLDGKVCIDGCELAHINGATLRRKIGVSIVKSVVDLRVRCTVTVFTLQLVQQEPVLFATSIEDNIRFGKPEATPDEVIEAATIANAHEFISQLPERYKTMVGERGVRLSGGQVSPGTAHMTNFYSHSRCNVAETKDRHRASCIAKSCYSSAG